MSEQKHTQGPWKVRRANAYEALDPTKCHSIDGQGWGAFALIATDMEFQSDTAEGLANARLIAAAPEMLTALKNLRNADDVALAEGYSGTMGQEQRAAVESVIAKAEGRS